jgi:hypothetical protein
MPTFDDPIADSEQARLALRGLAHATRNVEFPGDAYQVIGSLLDGLRSLEQTLDQLAAVHTTNVRRSYGEDRKHGTGMTEVHVTAAALHRAAREIGRTQMALEVALQHSGRIVWGEPLPAMADGVDRRELHIADPDRDADRDNPGLGL